ncbi:alpha/beta hydrolase fold domain-containing protein [Streptomyces sp. NPDC005408]|uniref:alpha/beta hydrolase n=1 Tax=Streptomyces sp. NPDC005408 TaxID=3155341 RepID=UPI0033B14CB7
MKTTEVHTVPYVAAHGSESRFLDVYRPAGQQTSAPCVLLWHGVGPDERDVMATLANRTAALGRTVFVPDWRPDGADGGRSHLLASLRYVRDNAAAHGTDAQQIILAGWSAGAGAAVALALRPDLTDGWRPAAVVGIAGAYDRPARSTASVPHHDLAETSASPVPVRLVHGSADSAVDGHHSRALHTALRARRWPVQLEEPDTDHAGVIGTEFDPALGRCRAATDPRVLDVGTEVARVIATAAGSRVSGAH